VEAPEAGTILRIFYKEGDDVPVLDTIAIIGEPGEKIEHLSPTKIISVPKVEYGEKQKVVTPDKSLKKIKPSLEIGSISISPVARRLAEEKGIDFSQLIGTGPGGRIIKKDIENAIAEGEALVSSTVSENFLAPAKEITVEGVRKIISERMMTSLQSTAQLTLNASADATNLLACRESLKSSPPMKGLNTINMNDFLLYIVAHILPKFKNMNAHFLKEKILEFEQVHLGFAVDSPRGLMVPVIHNAHLLSLQEIYKEARRLITACQEENILPDELKGGTFTITNLGTMGVESFTPILNIPQVAILGVCNVSLKPMLKEDKIQFIPHLGLSLTFDHRAIDGAPAAKFLQKLNRHIANFNLTDLKLP